MSPPPYGDGKTGICNKRIDIIKELVMGRAWGKSETEFMEHGGGCPFEDILVLIIEGGSPSQITLPIDDTSVDRLYARRLSDTCSYPQITATKYHQFMLLQMH